MFSSKFAACSKPPSIDNCRKGLFIQNATAAWRRARRNGLNKIN